MSVLLGTRRALLTRNKGGGAAPITDAQLIALFGPTAGFYFEPDMDRVTQLSDGSSPVTADGQPTGRYLDKSPNGFNQAQATAAARPLWKTDGALFWLLYQGSDDHLRNTIAQLPLTDFYYCDVVEETSVLANAGISVIQPAAGNDYERVDGLVLAATSNKTDGKYELVGSSSFTFALKESAPAATLAQRAVREVVKIGGTAGLYVNGVLVSTDNSFNAFNALSAGGFLSGARYLSGVTGPFFIGREFFKFFIGRAVTSDERTLVRTRAAARGGITL